MPSRRISMFVATIILALANLAGAEASQPSREPISGDFAGMVTLEDGRSIYVECAGSGGPTVILISGYRTRADVWTDDLFDPTAGRQMVLSAIAERTRVCAYDRPGTASVLDDVLHPSRSDPAAMPRTIEDVAAEFRELRLAVAGEAPVILVAHSLGGLVLRFYASLYHDDVAGIVLVDALSEFVEEEMPPGEFPAYAVYASLPTGQLANYPDLETIDFATASATLRAAAEVSPLPDVPMAVLSKGEPFGLPDDAPGFSVDAFEAAWAASQARLAALLPDAQHITVDDSSHYIQLERPDLVIASIERVLEAVRTREPRATPVEVSG